MTFRSALFIVASVAACMSAPVLAEGDPAAGEKLAETCMGCHGVDGYFNVYPSYHVPRLAGQGEKYIVSALSAYKAGSSKHPTMTANAINLSEQEMADIGAYLESLGR